MSALLLVWLSALPAWGQDLCGPALAALNANPHRDHLMEYEQARVLGLQAQKPLDAFVPAQGTWVTRRNERGEPTQVRFQVLAGNPEADRIAVVGDFNHWTPREGDWLKRVGNSDYHSGHIEGLPHQGQYRLLVNGQQLIDPAATTHTPAGASGSNYLNSVFWDFGHPTSFRPTAPPVDLRGKPVVLLETEAASLVKHFEWNGHRGPRSLSETYRFIAESGIVEELKKRGYNAIEFLPLNPSVDGDAWHLRYQVFGLYGPDARYGTPDDYARMVDAFNRAGIGVIVDTLYSHYPRRGNDGVRALEPVGLTQWKRADGRNLYGDWDTPWNTSRYDFGNPNIRRFLVDSTLTLLTRYRNSGVRLDNLGDGIWTYDGPGGGGPELIHEMVREARAYLPGFWGYGEIFVGRPGILNNRDQGGAGIDVRHDAPLFGFIRENLLKPTEQVDMNNLRNALRGPWDWKEVPLVGYATSHDEAANNSGGATGQYVASSIRAGNHTPEMDYYVLNKSKAFGSLPFLARSGALDMLQLRFLQEGNFSHHPEVRWDRLNEPNVRHSDAFFTALSQVVASRPAFNFSNLHPNIENHLDHNNKVISFLRIDHATGKRVYGIVNLGHQPLENYRFGVEGERFKVVLDGDRPEFGGSGTLSRALPSGELTSQAEGAHDKPRSLVVPHLAPYSTLIIEQP